MNINEFLKYKVQKGDTLTNVALRIGMNPIDLKFFHNERSSVEDYIHLETLSPHKIIYIPLNNRSSTELLKEQFSERPNRNFTADFYSQNYHVNETIENFGEDKIVIDYNVLIDVKDDIVTLHQQNFLKQNKFPDDKMSDLALACTNSILPLSFQVSSNGEIISSFDHQSTIQRFKDKRSEIEEYHIGEVSKSYLDTFEYGLNNESYFLNQMKNSSLYHLLFPKLEWFYKTNTWEEKLYFSSHFKPKAYQLTATYHHHKTFVDSTIVGKSEQDDEVIYNYKTDKVSKKLLEISVCIKSQVMQHTIKITSKLI